MVSFTGGRYCAAGTCSKEWYFWGSGLLGTFRYPTKMSFLEGAESVSVGKDFGMFSKMERMFVWGCNSWGELGHHEEITNYVV
jgi:hypothetical protein